MLYFREKDGKIAAALGAPPPNPVGPPDPQLLLSSLASVTLKLQTYCKISYLGDSLRAP